MTHFTADDLAILSRWDTPTICNALEAIHPERRGHGFTVEPFSCLAPDLPPMVGLARTVRIRAASPNLKATGTPADRMPYYEYIAAGDLPRVVVIEDLDPRPGIGAFWGEVHTAVHKGLGALGAVTNGSYRDVTDSAPGFQLLGGLVGPSHAFVHVVDFGGPVRVHGMAVVHDDVIHADRHGAVVIPAEAVTRIPAIVDLQSRREAVVLGAARGPDFNIEKLRAALSQQQDIH